MKTSLPVLLMAVLTNSPGLAVETWGDYTFSTLPPIQKSGALILPADYSSMLGYDPSRQWVIGQTPDQFLMLGDVSDGFQLEQLSLQVIGELTGIDLNALTIGDVPLVKEQTMGSLLQAFPEWQSYTASQIAPIWAALRQHVSPHTLLREVLQDSRLANVSLASSLPLTSLPNVLAQPLARFPGWQGQFIDEIPGLNQVAFAALPLASGTPAFVDIVFGEAEQNIGHTVTGSYQDGFNVPCSTPCPHLELGPPFTGTTWIGGGQQVRGGHGTLKAVNNGLEPTGRHPHGTGFKVVLHDTDEATGEAQFALYFRACVKTTLIDLGCTPYSIGPVPWLPIREESWTVL